jgi:indolepyruvate ferredoxin oxidoreductase
MKQTFHATRGLKVDDELLRDVIVRAYDCLVWGGTPYARQYCALLVKTFCKDLPQRNFAITRAVVWNLAKVMLIKDEVYVSAMLTNPEKYQRDRRRFNVNPARGDRIHYKHHNRPEFELFGKRIRFEWKARDWQLRLMAGCSFLRKWMPRWHRREKEFRDWYISLVDQFQGADIDSESQYNRWLAVLDTPRPVTGFREVRYPKMDAARKRVDALFAADADRFATPVEPAATSNRSYRDVALPVMHS